MIPVISVTPETVAPEAARWLLGRSSALYLVLDTGGRLVGVVSEGDPAPGRRTRPAASLLVEAHAPNQLRRLAAPLAAQLEADDRRA